MAGAGSAIRIANAYVQLSVRGNREIEARLTQAQAVMLRTAQSAVRVGRTMAIASGIIGGAFLASVKAASDLEEAINKTKQVFRDQSVEILEWSKISSRAFGLSRKAALEYASEFGLILDKSGQAADATARMSQELVELAGDAASFNNVSLDVALEKIKSGLVGEAKPLRSFGVLLSEATVSARALEIGFEKVNGELTEGAKVFSRQQLITEQLEAAQGDFARTSGDVANQSRILTAQITDLAAAIGTALLPEVKKANESIIGLLDSSTKWVKANQAVVLTSAAITTVVGTAGLTLIAIGAAIGPLARGIETVGAAFRLLGRVLVFVRNGLQAIGAAVSSLTGAIAVLIALVATVGLDFLISGEFTPKTLLEYIKARRKANELEREAANVFAQSQDRREAAAEKNKADAKQAAKDAENAKAIEAERVRLQEEKLEKAKALRDELNKEWKTLIDQRVELKFGKAAYEDRLLKARGVGKETRNQFAALRASNRALEEGNKLAEEKQKASEKYTKDINDRIQALDIENIRINQGEEAAAKAQDIYDKIAKTDRNILAAKRQQNALDQEKIDKAKEASELAKEAAEAAKEEAKAKKESAQATIRELQLQLVALKKGEEAAQRKRDKDQGYNQQDRQKMAELRGKIQTEEDRQEAFRRFSKSQGGAANETGAGGSAFNKALFGNRFGQLGSIPQQTLREIKIQRRIQARANVLRKKNAAYLKNGNANTAKFQADARKWFKRMGITP